MVNEEEVVGASTTAGEGAHNLHCTAPGMSYAVAWWPGVHMNTVEGVPLSESGGCVMWSCCKLEDTTHSPYCHSSTTCYLRLGSSVYSPNVWLCTGRDLG